MDGSYGLPTVGFDGQSFWHQAEAVLARGTREMLINAGDRKALVAAYDRMDEALGELVETSRPPECVKAALFARMEERIRVVGDTLRAEHIDVKSYWEADMKSVAIVVLKALGRTGNIRLDRVVEDAATALCEGNFSGRGARRLLAELSTYGCKDLGQLVYRLEDTPCHMDFLRLLKAKGTGKAVDMAQKAMDRMTPEAQAVPVQLAKVIRMPDPAIARKPLRHA
jgi:hypothetical protein